MSGFQVPLSTYRVQFNRDFRFADCRDLVPYLHELGVGTLYSSPRFRARSGSSHGYDVANPARVNSELGTDEDFDDLCEKLRHYGMGLLLDTVPNHMAASHENSWWMDVLENGPGSVYARYFDVDWRPTTHKAAFLQENKVLLPVLGDLYGSVLESGEITLHLDEAGFYARYYERRFPIDPATYAPLLEHCAGKVAGILDPEHPCVADLRRLQMITAKIPARTATSLGEVGRRKRIARVVKERLFAVYRDQLDARHAVDQALRELSIASENRELLDRILSGQGFRLAHWKIGCEEINYRRFFDINDLVCLRVEEPEVFLARHQSIFQLIQEGKVTGLRVDHVDGLHDPRGYLERLQRALGDSEAGRSFYVVVEKILGEGEQLPEDWPVCGTTGYDFLNMLNDLFIDPEGLRALEASYAEFTGEKQPFAEICYARNKQVMRTLFAGEVNALGHHLARLAAQDRKARDVPVSELTNAIVEVTACLPVYRTYIREFEIPEHDRRYLERTLDFARRRAFHGEVTSAAFDFLGRVLLLNPPPYLADQKTEWLDFVMRWQKFTGPVMAKGLEDTAFYVHNALISRNEVGGDPLRERPPHGLDDFHRFLERRQDRSPRSMNTTSTHDTKRSEDVRARINVLSELPEEWARRVLRWSRGNRDQKTETSGRMVPVPSEEMLLYQSIVGAWPLDEGDRGDFLDRLKGFALKAVREAKTHSDWLYPSQAHEEALVRFLDGILGESNSGRFFEDLLRFEERISLHGAINSLSQLLIKITAPGVPEIYRGTELWDFSLVDPDNRRPVDFRKRTQNLEELRVRALQDRNALLRDLISGWRNGRIKLYLMDTALDFRRIQAQLFLKGAYIPLTGTGPHQRHVIAYARRFDDTWSLTVAPRWTVRLVPAGRFPLGKGVWEDTALVLPEGAPAGWRNVLTGDTVPAGAENGGARSLPLRRLLHRFPVGLFAGEAVENAG